ncbi:MAG: tetratricopeptide repeat protein [Treponema sp.]|nr:tetratricopeptide repeat protein [Treponema sp.]
MIEHPDKLNNQAIILAADGNYTDAIACFKRAIILDRDNCLLWFNLGVTYKTKGDLILAKKALLKSHELNSLNDDVTETLATICLHLKDFESVETYCLEGINNNPSNSNLWNILGVKFFQSEDYNTASYCFESALTINPYHKDALYNLKDTYSELNNTIGESECENRLKEIP